jgi:PAS domain S-box-containing protein
MTHDQSMVELATRSIDAENVIGGQQAEFFWHMIVRLQAVIHNIQESIISISPQGIIEGANPATVNIFGYAVDQLIGQNIKMLMPEPDQSQHESYLQEYQRTGKRHVIGQYRELVALDKDGRQFPLEMNIAEMKLGGEKHFIGLLRGITERKIAEEKLTELALFDQLTALPNRKNFLGRVEYSLFSAKRIKAVVALFFIDLNGFKKINDSLGHATGDHVLKAVVCVPVSGSRIPLPAWAAMNLRSYSIT